jgi:acyl-CoA thioesterase FadM
MKGSTPEPIEVEIRWDDIDAYGHVHHAALIALADHARSRWLDRIFDSPATWDYVVVRLVVDYRGELKFADRTGRWTFAVARVGNSSITLSERVVTPAGQLAAEGEAVIVAWDKRERVTRPLLQSEQTILGELGGGQSEHDLDRD